MYKKIAALTVTAVMAASPAFGSGYRIPEQSINSVALSNAYIANAHAADASYFNPANMSWLEDGWHSEVSLTYINLASIDYTDAAVSSRNGDSKEEEFLLPELHIVSPMYNNFRFGFSVVYPFGLSKRWDESFPKTFAEDFTLKTYEFNPTVSYKVSDKISFGMGLRAIHTKGEVKSTGLIDLGGPVSNMHRNMDGDSTDYGYNFALTYKPISNLSLAATYRSRVSLNVEGNATLSSSLTSATYSGGASVSVPAPAVLTLATAYTFDQTTVELTYDKTYWNAYDQLDFNYASALGDAGLTAVFDAAKAKNWVNTEAFRIGVTHKLNKQWTVMAGFAIDDNPAPDNTLGFELPDSDAKLYSIGARYKMNDKLEVGAAYLYDDKESRSATNSGGVNGTFDNAAAHLVNIGVQYRF